MFHIILDNPHTEDHFMFFYEDLFVFSESRFCTQPATPVSDLFELFF